MPWGCDSSSDLRQRALPLLLGALWACSGEPTGGATARQADRQAYVLAARHPGEVGRCSAIQDAALGRECVALAAGELARQGEVAAGLGACRGLQTGRWRDECVFAVVDLGDLRGEAARSGCAQAGAFADRCRGHVLRKLAGEALPAFGIGQEAEALAAMEALVAAWAPQGGPDRASLLLVEHLAGRSPEQPFGRSHCGSLDPERCAQVYAQRVQIAGRALAGGAHAFPDGPPWLAACPPPVSPGRAAALGLPTWDPEMHATVTSSWERLCGPSPHEGRP